MYGKITVAWAAGVIALATTAGCSETSRRSGDGGSEPADGAASDDDGATDDDGGTTGDGGTGTASGKIGDPCTSDSDCTEPADAECFMSDGPVDWPNGFCSKACEESAECGDGEAGCASLSMSGGGGGVSGMFCSPPCESDADCRSDEGYSCTMILGFGFCSPPGF